MSSELSPLVKLSARIGHDINLVQAGGGNTSIKVGNTLWIKASGKWMINAEEDDIFVPVPMADIQERLETGEERFPEYSTGAGKLLRPSVETTMHAVLPHRVVIHVHSVAAIALAAQLEGEDAVSKRLAGLRWAWIPYIHPGVPLALCIREKLAEQPDILLLGNHGLVVGGEDCVAAEALLYEVDQRLSAEPRPSKAPDLPALEELAQSAGWLLADDPEVHALATNITSTRIASGGTMYPDHCVYLGPAAPYLRPAETMDVAVERHTKRHNYQPTFMLVEGLGVLVSPQLSRAGRELLVCLKRVVERIPAESSVRYLEDYQVARLMNWDAEKYRLAMAQLEK
jgi:rhamnose utilization protein RhaD (predicted bifunctional aldolase and dehydrogenase)